VRKAWRGAQAAASLLTAGLVLGGAAAQSAPPDAQRAPPEAQSAPAGAQDTPAEARGAPVAKTGDIKITVTGIENAKGVLLVGLYQTKKSWLEPDQSTRFQRLKPTPPEQTVEMKALPPGIYAIGVVHDENENGKPDLAIFPYPHLVEGAGMSNNPTSRIGPPSFKQSKFELTSAGKQLVIRLQK